MTFNLLETFVIGTVMVALLVFEVIGFKRRYWSILIPVNVMSILSVIPSYYLLKLYLGVQGKADNAWPNNEPMTLLSFGPLPIFAMISFGLTGWLFYRIYSNLL